MINRHVPFCLFYVRISSFLQSKKKNNIRKYLHSKSSLLSPNVTWVRLRLHHIRAVVLIWIWYGKGHCAKVHKSSNIKEDGWGVRSKKKINGVNFRVTYIKIKIQFTIECCFDYNLHAYEFLCHIGIFNNVCESVIYWWV